MPSATPFPELIRRVRGGEAEAASELVERYEPAIRRAVRVRLVDARLRRLLDSTDICQSVLGSFFVRAALGQYELNSPEQLLKLLVTIARNKLADEAKHQQAARRDVRRMQGTSAAAHRADAGPTPSQHVAADELFRECHKRLTADEEKLAEQRRLGREWADIAADWGEHPEVLRKRLARAVERVTRELGLEV
jgi:RNA polymerase sigma-70 factor (ECF subfamily)